MPQAIRFKVNGQAHEVLTPPDRALLDVLREDLHLTGPKYGCGEMRCGACGVLIDDQRVFSCSTPIGSVADKSVTTIEGLATDQGLHPVQQAFLDEQAYQCGYCTGGMIVAATALLRTNPNPSEKQIVAAMNGNLCRCCGYPKILSAVRRAAGLEVKSP
jgi:aerobic-type carbon monoxide dehydrogenase small subunit (CoxS/CutS family)